MIWLQNRRDLHLFLKGAARAYVNVCGYADCPLSVGTAGQKVGPAVIASVVAPISS